MKRIISKVDYEMYKRGQIDPKLALDLWYRICKNETIIKSAVEVNTNQNGEKCFLAPAICHMILSNPWDVSKEIYDSLVLTLLKDAELNKLSVFNNTTFLCLIMLNGALGFDDLYIELASDEIRQKTKDGSFEIRKVEYKDVIGDGEIGITYENDDFKVTLTESEIDLYNKNYAFTVNNVESFDEIDALAEIVQLFPMLDEKIVRNINELSQYLENQKRTLKKNNN